MSRSSRPAGSSARSSTRRGTGASTRGSGRSPRSRPDRSATRRSPLRPTLTRRQQLIAAGVAVLLVVALAVAWFTPLLSVRQVEVQGASAVSQEQVLAKLDVPMGTPLLRVDLDGAAARLTTLPRVARATVDRHYPSGLTVTVTERVPVAFVDKADGPHLLDATGVDFAAAAPTPGVPRLLAPNPVAGDPLTTAALQVVAALPPPVRAQVAQVAPESPVDVRFTLLDGRTVVWGAPADQQRKGAVLAAVLSQPGKTYDVSSPDLPTVS